ncbi:hypothetical protein LBMAG27_24910 [Bacteroidota bacterium]|nr:hypothetical protein LBMAG27_24910 [Bacteroidota bacterium]
MKKFIFKNHLVIILLGGFILRLFFYFFGAKVYYGKSDFFIGGDTSGWVTSILNLINHGSYSIDLNEPTGYFFRPPGYSFFFGIFYLLSGKNLSVAYHLVVWAQLFMDVISIWFIYDIVQRSFKNQLWSSITAILYAAYPFVIVWTAIVYAESTSVFLLLAGFWFFTNDKIKYHFFWSGIFIGIAALTRLQILFFLPAAIIALFFNYRNYFKTFLKTSIPFIVAFSISFGLWPARNYLLQGRLLFSQDLSAVACWDKDYMAFMDYIFSIKTDHQPQYSQMINGEKVTWPKDSYIVPGDSEKLESVVKMCRTCGHGFSVFMKNEGLRKNDLPLDSSCSIQIAVIWNNLKENQVKFNKANVYLWVPLNNFKKSIFKSDLYKPSSKIVSIVSTVLFGYRTIMILLGLFGLLLYYRVKKEFPIILKLIICYFFTWYFWNSFVYRNMEIRYLMQTDILLLIPAAFCFVVMIEKYFLKKQKPERVS